MGGHGAVCSRARNWRAVTMGIPDSLPICVLSAAFDSHDGDQAFLVVDVVDHTPMTDTNPPAPDATQFAAARRARVTFQAQDGRRDAAEIRLVDTVQLLAYLAIEELNSVG